jgi:hypothetical protein
MQRRIDSRDISIYTELNNSGVPSFIQLQISGLVREQTRRPEIVILLTLLLLSLLNLHQRWTWNVRH